MKIVHLLLIKRYFVSFVIFGTNYQYNLKHFDEKRKMGIMVPKQFLYEENKTNIYSQFKMLAEIIRKGFNSQSCRKIHQYKLWKSRKYTVL